MTWLAAIGLAFKPVILPILTLIVGWVIPTPQQLLAKKLAATQAAEQAGKGLDPLP